MEKREEKSVGERVGIKGEMREGGEQKGNGRGGIGWGGGGGGTDEDKTS